MPEEGQKHFLDNFFRVVHGYAKGEDIAEKWIAKLLEQMHDLTLDL
jgi:hypothetical protein